MSSTVLRKSETRWNNTMKWLVAAALVIAVIVGALFITQANPPASVDIDTNDVTAPVTTQSVTIPAAQAPDVYAAQLDQLRRMAINAAGWDGPTAYAYSLEALAQFGRQTLAEGVATIRQPTLIIGNPAPMVYGAQLDQLRRMAINANLWDGPTLYAYSLEALAQTGREAQLASRPDPNDFSAMLDELRRLDQ